MWDGQRGARVKTKPEWTPGSLLFSPSCLSRLGSQVSMLLAGSEEWKWGRWGRGTESIKTTNVRLCQTVYSLPKLTHQMTRDSMEKWNEWVWFMFSILLTDHLLPQVQTKWGCQMSLKQSQKNQWMGKPKENVFSSFLKLNILTSYISRTIIFMKSSSTLVLLAWAIWAKVVRRQISSELFMEERHFSKFTKCSGSASPRILKWGENKHMSL